MVQLSCEIKAISAPSWGLAGWLGLSLAIMMKLRWMMMDTVRVPGVVEKDLDKLGLSFAKLS